MKQLFLILTFLISLAGMTSCKEAKNPEQEPSSKSEKKDSQGSKKDTIVSTGKLYAVSKYFTPVINTKNFSAVYGGKDGKTLKRSKNGLIKELEYVAYPGSIFEILDEYKNDNYSVYKVYTDEYDISELNIELFVDSRFVDVTDKKPEKRKIELPSKEKIYEYLDKSVGALYVWGANNIDGVKEMMEFYTPKGKLNDKESKEWQLKGVDCSGVIYEATNGYTSRNTHQMVYMGDAVDIEGLSAKEIAKKIEPLDIIVWKGHVILVYDKKTTIESSFSAGGVIKKDLVSVLTKLMQKRTPVNEWGNGGSVFVVRRWYKENNN